MNHLVSSAVLAATAGVAGLSALSTSPATVTTALQATPDVAPMAQCVETDSVSAIFAPGTDPKIVEQVSQAIQQLSNDRFAITGRWPGADNTPVTVTYSFPSDGVNVPDGVGEGAGANNLNASLTGQFGSEGAWKAKFAQIFQDWADITGNVYIEVSDDDASLFGSSGPLHGGSGHGDVRITGKNIDGGFGILAYNFFPGAGGGDMVIDTSENWSSPTNDFRFFRNTLSHEHGHGMGLLHVCPAVGLKLMEPFLNTNFDGPQHDDIRGATHHYGDFYEPNENSASAAFIGALAGAGSTPFSIPNMAMRDEPDVDFYSFSVDGAGSVDVNLSIVGDIYENNGQDQACAPQGNLFDSHLRNDPELSVLDVDGSSVLATVDANGFGGDESLNGVVLPAAGTYFIRVQSAAFSGVAQIYDLDGTVTIDEVAAGCVADLNGDMIVDTADLGILLGVFGGVGPVGDLNGDGAVDTADLGILLGVFGTCVPI